MINNPYALIKITTDGVVSTIDCDCFYYDYYNIYDWINCDTFEIVNITKAIPLALMVVDESGLLKDKPINKVASVLYGNVIVGDVIIGVSEQFYPTQDLEPDIYAWDYVTARIVASDLMSVSNLLHGNYTA